MSPTSRSRYLKYLEKRKAAKKPEMAVLDETDSKKGAKRARTFFQLLKLFLNEMRGSRTMFIFALLTVAISSIGILSIPASTKLIIDFVLAKPKLPELVFDVSGSHLFNTPLSLNSLLTLLVLGLGPHVMLWAVSITNLFVAAISLGVGISGRFQTTLLTKRVSAQLRRRSFDHAVNLPLHRIQFHKSGGLSSILREDAGQAGELVFSMIYNPFKAIIQLVGTLAVLAWTDWRMLVGGLLVIPVVWFTNRAWITRIRPVFKDIRTTRSAIDAHTTEVFGGVRVVRSFDRGRSESTRFTTGQHYMIRKEFLVWWWSRILEVAWGVLIPLASGAVTVYAGYAILEGTLTLGDLFMFTTYLVMLLGPLELLTSTATNIQTNLAAYDRVLDLLEEPREFSGTDPTHIVDRSTARGEIQIQNVSFSYPKSGKADPKAPEPTLVLHDINLKIAPGENIALVGASGAGKTTLCNLVARFYDPTVGNIFFDGVNLKDIEPGSYRRLLGIVEQDVFLFDGTIAQNIAYGRRDATRQQIEAAASAAFAHEFITGLEKQYDTFIGERGVRLSGGQKQRIAISRAILADPAILILDEATSNLDAESEAFIQISLSKLMRGRTCFVIAHRLSTIRNADRIIVLEKGRVLEIGKHDELLSRGGRYSELLKTQLQAHAMNQAPVEITPAIP